MRRLLPGQYGGGSAYCAPGGGHNTATQCALSRPTGSIRALGRGYFALRAQYARGSAYCAPGGAQYGYAMRPISPYGLNTGSGARLFRSTSSIRRALNLPILTTQVLKSLQLHI